MRVIILKGDAVTGSVLAGADIRVKLTRKVKGRVILYGGGDDRDIDIDGDSVRLRSDLIDIDGVVVVGYDDRVICCGGVYHEHMKANSHYVVDTTKNIVADIPQSVSKKADNNEKNTAQYIDNINVVTNENDIKNYDDSEKSVHLEDNPAEYFYQKIRIKLEKMLAVYPHNKQLEGLVYDSEWIDVEYNGGDRYVVGLICEQGTPSVIAYGIPCMSMAEYTEKYPDSDWLPLDRRNIDGRGYSLTYQRVSDGTIIQRV